MSIIGQGYVGLPLALSAAEAGYYVTGVDLSQEKINLLNSSRSYLEDISNSQIESAMISGKYKATSDISLITESDVVVVCVPTPISSGKPDLSAIENSAIALAKYLTKGQLVILESTVEPETTRKFFVPLLEKGSGLKSEEFEVVFSPERIDPTNKKWTLKNTPKLVAGLTSTASIRAVDFYSRFIDNVIVVESLEVAETAKLLENSFRLVNISFINEISILCQKLGIDVNAVIYAAATKPYGFMPFYPSIGVGGHCIPIDPLYLANKARQVGASTRFIDLADQINLEMPGYFVGRAEEKLGGLRAKKILVVGVSYKPNVADVRETPVEALILGLRSKGAEVFWHDDLVKEWNGERSVALSNNYDLAILATPHDYLDLTKLGDVVVLNTRGSIK